MYSPMMGAFCLTGACSTVQLAVLRPDNPAGRGLRESDEWTSQLCGIAGGAIQIVVMPASVTVPAVRVLTVDTAHQDATVAGCTE